MKSLLATQHKLSKAEEQINVLTEYKGSGSFASYLKEQNQFPLRSVSLDVLQINLGKMCNQVCKHCHVDAGPDRKEIMTRETLQHCLTIIENQQIGTVDLTGGAPEMNPEFRWFVEELFKLSCKIIVRCNLTIILANPKYHDLPDFFKAHKVEVVSSLPALTALRTDSQRGKGVFEKSIEALQMLNKVGYGVEGTGLNLHLVYNPSGSFLPDDQATLEKEFKLRLQTKFGITFNQLFAITNVPISRYLDYLVSSEIYEVYMNKLQEAFNPTAITGVMCRNMLSVGWDGALYDCDFNQMLDLKIGEVSSFSADQLIQRNIIINNHCFACTAGAGSSCGGETV